MYTAITRAKCNLWIYDSGTTVKLPMLEYWHKRNAVRISTADTIEKEQRFISSTASTHSDWKRQGDTLRKKCLWQQACHCYEKAGYIHLVKETQALEIVQSAKKGGEISDKFFKAALLLFECDECEHDLKYILSATKCLKKSVPPRHLEAGKLLEKMEKLSEAAECYKSAVDFENFARVHESMDDYDRVIDSLKAEPFTDYLSSLYRFIRYKEKKYPLKHTLIELVVECCDHYLKKEDKSAMSKVLQHMTNSQKKLEYMKKAKMYVEAYELYTSRREYSSAIRLAKSQGMFRKSYDISIRKHRDYISLIFLIAKNCIDEKKTSYPSLIISELQKYHHLSKLFHLPINDN